MYYLFAELNRMSLQYHHHHHHPVTLLQPSNSLCSRHGTRVGHVSVATTNLREQWVQHGNRKKSARTLRFKSGRKVYAIAEPPTRTAGDAPNSVSEKPGAQEDEIKGGGRFDWNRQWYPVAVTNDLHTDAPYGVTVIGRPLAVWWDASSSKWQVYADECPHRLAPLSEGSISEDGHLRCSYHGWTFKGDGGDCTGIPQALPTSARPLHESKRACVQVYPSMEQQGILWFWPDLSQGFINVEAAASPPPSFPWLSNPEFAYDMSTRDLEYGYETLVENLVDPAHAPFAHHNIQGSRETAFPMTLTVTKVDPSGHVGDGDFGSVVFKGPCTITYDIKFPPDITMQDTVPGENSANNFMKAIFILLNKLNPKKERLAGLIALCIPVSPGRSRIIWSFPRNFGTSLFKIMPKWVLHMTNNLVLDSDMTLLNFLERRLEVHGADNWTQFCYAPAPADGYVHAFRKWLRDYAGGAPDWAGRFENRLPPSPPKRIMMDRYYTHVLKCKGCHRALKNFKVLEVVLQALSVSLLGLMAVVAAAPEVPLLQQVKPFSVPLVCVAVASALLSRWLSRFIYRNFYFQDYNHAAIK